MPKLPEYLGDDWVLWATLPEVNEKVIPK